MKNENLTAMEIAQLKPNTVKLVFFPDVNDYGLVEYNDGDKVYYDRNECELDREFAEVGYEVIREVKVRLIEGSSCWELDEVIPEFATNPAMIDVNAKSEYIEQTYGLGEVNDYGDKQEALYCEYCGCEVAPDKAHEVEQRNKPWGVLLACKACAEKQDELIQLT